LQKFNPRKFHGEAVRDANLLARRLIGDHPS